MANISVVLTIDNQKYIADLKRAEDATKSFASATQEAGDKAATNLNKAGSAASALHLGLGRLNGAITAAAFLGFAKSALAFADTIDDLSKSTGLATNTILSFREASIVAGGSLEGASRGLQYFMIQLDGAREGTAKSQQAFYELGINLSDLGKLSEKDLFEKTLRGLAKLREEGASTAKIITIQNELLGKSYKGVTIDAEFIRKLEEGKIKYSDMADSIKRASDLNDQFQLSLGKLQTAFVTVFNPAIKLVGDLSEWLGKSTLAANVLGVALLAIPGIAVGRALVSAFSYVARGLLSITGAASGAGSAISALSGTNLGRLKNIGAALGAGSGAVLGAAAIASPNSTEMELGFGPGKRAPITAEDYQKIADAKAQAAEQASNKVIEANKAEANIVGKEVPFAYQQKAQAIANSTIEFQRSAAQITNNVKLETFLIGKSKDFADSMRAQADMVSRTESEILKLQNAKAALSEAEKTDQGGRLVAVYDEQIAKLKQIQQEEKTRIAIAIENRNKAENAEKLRLFGLQAQYDSQRRVNEITHQAATALYPELQKRIDNLTKSILDSAEAEIHSEEVRRNTILTETERQAIREKALIGLQAEIDATLELYKAEQKRELVLFKMKQRITLENDLQKIQDEMAKMTLPELERKYYDIEAAARESAKAQIDAAAQAGKALSPEEQQAYYDAALEGVNRLKQATKESYDASRTFSTGWKKAFNDYIDSATNAARTAENLFNKAMGGIEDALVNFVKTGKFEWKSFVNSMAEELLRSQIKETFASIMKGMSGGGGILGSIGSLFGLGGATTAGAQRGQNAAQPLYVLDVSNSGMGAAAALPGMSGILGQANLPSLFENYGFNPLSGSAGPDIQRQISGGGIGGGLFSGIGDTLGSIADSIGSFFGGGNTNTGGGLTDLFDGLFASGGTIGAGRFGIAGEAGPELIGGPATVMPMSGSQNVVYNINAVDASSFKALVAQDPGFIHAVVMQGAKSMPGSRR